MSLNSSIYFSTILYKHREAFGDIIVTTISEISIYYLALILPKESLKVNFRSLKKPSK
jgi:hypothetical protein